MDTFPGGSESVAASEGRMAQSTISRFACRILADRADPKIAKIYAAGFDTSRNIFLGVCSKMHLLILLSNFNDCKVNYKSHCNHKMIVSIKKIENKNFELS